MTRPLLNTRKKGRERQNRSNTHADERTPGNHQKMEPTHTGRGQNAHTCDERTSHAHRGGRDADQRGTPSPHPRKTHTREPTARTDRQKETREVQPGGRQSRPEGGHTNNAMKDNDITSDMVPLPIKKTHTQRKHQRSVYEGVLYLPVY